MDDLQLPNFRTVKMEMVDIGSGSSKQPFTVFISPLGVTFRAEGYNDPLGTRLPVSLRLIDGELVVTIWANINSQHPTHFVSLNGARETNRAGSIPIPNQAQLATEEVLLQNFLFRNL